MKAISPENQVLIESLREAAEQLIFLNDKDSKSSTIIVLDNLLSVLETYGVYVDYEP